MRTYRDDGGADEDGMVGLGHEISGASIGAIGIPNRQLQLDADPITFPKLWDGAPVAHGLFCCAWVCVRYFGE